MTKSYKNRSRKGGKRKNTTLNSRNRNKKHGKKTFHSLENFQKAHIVKVFLEMMHMIKLYHWKTHSYAQHKATDELYSKLNENIDKFVEVLLGKSSHRVKMMETKMKMYDLEDKMELKEHIFEYRQFLIDMDRCFSPKKDSDLFSLRDDILGDLNQFLYLLSFDQP
jgi:DNA-binding ferritin-like protein